MIVGYARVGTNGQSHDAQQAALREAGAQRVFSEKQSGANRDRAALARCLASSETGDTLLATKLDRLARFTRDLLNTLPAVAERELPSNLGRWLGRYHNITWQVDADGAWGIG
jgi:DNA invertase Pin-like site-specific DNA recombinase